MLQNSTLPLLPRPVTICLVVSLVAAASPVSAKTPPSGQHTERPAARNAAHVDRAVRQQTLSEALQYIWQDHTASTGSH